MQCTLKGPGVSNLQRVVRVCEIYHTLLQGGEGNKYHTCQPTFCAESLHVQHYRTLEYMPKSGLFPTIKMPDMAVEIYTCFELFSIICHSLEATPTSPISHLVLAIKIENGQPVKCKKKL